MYAWMRVLTVTFTSKKYKNKIVFGENYLQGKEDLNINVSINKYMSSLKDTATIKISNLTYNEIVRLISGEYYDVEIKAGYRSSGAQTVFKGGVLYISNSLDNRKSNTAIILCASNLVAKYGQSRLNLSLNSGINIYSALKFICKMANIKDSNISTQLKKSFINEVLTVNDTAGSWIEKLANSNQNYIVNSDSITDSTVTIFNANKSNGRIIDLKSSMIELVGGHPQLNKDGLKISLTPTFPLMCGDIIQIDNSLIDIHIDTKEQIQNNPGYYLDKEGMYMIYEISYTLQNRGSAFTVNLDCKTRSLISNLIGGSSK